MKEEVYFVNEIRAQELSIIEIPEERKKLVNRPTKDVFRFLRKVSILILAMISRTYIPFLIIGLINRPLKLIKSAFLCYPGDPRYAKHYGFDFFEPWLKWFPHPIGFYKQGKYWGLVIASTMKEEEFSDPKNQVKLRRMLRRLILVSKLIGAEKVQLAGILPSLVERRLPDLGIGVDEMASMVVIAAAKKIMFKHFLNENIPTILLGGNGKIGRAIKAEFESISREVHIVDPNGGLKRIPAHLHGKKALLVDVSRADSLAEYSRQLWPEVIILNETFPEPRGKALRAFKEQGLRIFHLSGVSGKVVPNLPFGYLGAVPCCAIHDSNDLDPILVEL